VVGLLVRFVAAVTTKLPSADEAVEMLVEPTALILTLPAAALALKLATFMLKADRAPISPPVDVRFRIGVDIASSPPFSMSPPALGEPLVVAVIARDRRRVPAVAVRLTTSAPTVPAPELERSVAAVATKLPAADEVPEILVEPVALMSTSPAAA